MNLGVSNVNTPKYNKAVSFKQLYIAPSQTLVRELLGSSSRIDHKCTISKSIQSLKDMEKNLKETKYLHGYLGPHGSWPFLNFSNFKIMTPWEFNMPEEGTYNYANNEKFEIRKSGNDTVFAFNPYRFGRDYILKCAGTYNDKIYYHYCPMENDKYCNAPDKIITKAIIEMDNAIKDIADGNVTRDGVADSYDPYPMGLPKDEQADNSNFWDLFYKYVKDDLIKIIEQSNNRSFLDNVAMLIGMA